MTRSLARACGLVAALLLLVWHGGRAQDQPVAGDPRVGLTGGFRTAAVASRHMSLVTTLPRPAGFFDPKAPAGEPTAPEEKPKPDADDDDDDDREEAQALDRAERLRRELAGGLNFANTDLAFKGEQLFLGNFHGFTVYDIEDPRRARLLASVVCPGGQGDVSVHGNLLIMSVEQTRGRLDCGTQGVGERVSPERFRGIRIFDIADPRRPRQVAAVQTCRGSHTHTLVSDPDEPQHLYVYGSGTSIVRPGEELEGCSGRKPDEDPNTSLFSIDVIRIPLDAPERAQIVSRPRIFGDEKTGEIAALWKGGDHGPGSQKTAVTNQCHDITVYPALGLAAGACSGNGLLLDISDPVKPVRLDAVADPNFAYWHSATFNNDGTKVIFTDEWGGGTRPRCRESDSPLWGANAIFDIVDRRLRFGGYYKLPAPQTAQENCVAHNGSIIPVPGRDLMVQAWYQGGVSVFDFTDSARPFEIAFFDRGPIDPKRLITAGYWSTYWYNGHIYGAEIARGLDVFRLTPSEHLTEHEIAAAAAVRMPAFNAQQQPRIEWPAVPVVALAYLDQLQRDDALSADRLRALRDLVDRVDRQSPTASNLSAPLVDELHAAAGRLQQEAASAPDRTAARLRGLASTLTGLATRRV